MKRNMMFTTCMTAMTMCFSTLTATIANNNLLAQVNLDTSKSPLTKTDTNEANVLPDPRLRESIDRQKAVQEYEGQITDIVNGKYLGKNVPEEEKKAEIAKVVDTKIQEVYKYQGEATDEIKQQIEIDREAKAAFDKPLESWQQGGSSDYFRYENARPVYDQKRESLGIPVDQEKPEPTTNVETTDSEVTEDTSSSAELNPDDTAATTPPNDAVVPNPQTPPDKPESDSL